MGDKSPTVLNESLTLKRNWHQPNRPNEKFEKSFHRGNIPVLWNSMIKNAAQFILAFLVMSILIMAEAAPASASTKPSVPQFAVSFEPYPYCLPPEYCIDP